MLTIKSFSSIFANESVRFSQLKMNVHLYFLSIFFLQLNEIAGGPARTHHQSAEDYCRDLEPQKSMDIEQMMGLWYAVEVVEHRPNLPRSNQGTTIIDSCPVLHLAQTSAHSIRLVWSEKAGQIDYRFTIPDSESPGYWMSTGPQNGSMVFSTNYQQFAGTVQILKATPTYAVVTFCSPNSQRFSLILNREHYMSRRDLRDLNNFLHKKNLTLEEIKEACRNSASGITASNTTFMVILVVLLFNLIWRTYCD